MTQNRTISVLRKPTSPIVTGIGPNAFIVIIVVSFLFVYWCLLSFTVCCVFVVLYCFDVCSLSVVFGSN